MANAIREALRLAERIPARGVRKQAVAVKEQIEKAEVLRRSVLGVEQHAASQLKDNLLRLRREHSSLENFLKLKTRFHRLSLEPLTWRNAQGWPRLVLFDINSPRAQFSAIGRRGWDGRLRYKPDIAPRLSAPLAACYKDVIQRLSEEAVKSKKSTHLEFRFEGLIPENVRARIHEVVEQKLFKNVYIIAEPKRFSLRKSAVRSERRPAFSLKGDPLAVGFDGENLWLIADFDTTSVEEAMIFTDPDKKK